MDKLLIQLFSAFLIFVVVVFSILNFSIKDKKFTCNRYILNTYLYIILTFNIIALLMFSMEYYKINYNPSLLMFLGTFLITIGCIFLMHNISADQIILKHLVWLAFVLLLGLIFFPMYISYKNKKHLIVSAIATTLLLFMGLSIVAYLKPEWISLSWGAILLLLLIGGIIMEVFTLVFYRKNLEKVRPLLKAMTYFFIVVFMVFILYDTKRLQINAKECVKADYIKESLGLFLDIFNIFVRVLSLGK